MSDAFDANQIPPQYAVGAGSHPVGLFDAQIINRQVKPVKDKPNNKFLEIEYKTPVGVIADRFNLWNDSPQATEIAAKQLSAICHATAIYRLSTVQGNAAAELQGAFLKIEIGWQKGQEPGPDRPHGGYTEVKKVFDRNGNEPGKPSSGAAPTAQQGQAPMQQNTGGGWGAAPQPQNAPAAPQGWQAPPQQQPQQGAAWVPGAAPQSEKPPWAK